jgi:hypothetical protein
MFFSRTFWIAAAVCIAVWLLVFQISERTIARLRLRAGAIRWHRERQELRAAPARESLQSGNQLLPPEPADPVRLNGTALRALHGTHLLQRAARRSMRGAKSSEGAFGVCRLRYFPSSRSPLLHSRGRLADSMAV